MERKLNYLINLSFYLYFLILIVERTLSVVLTFVNGINIFSNGFYGYTYVLVFVSFALWLIYLLLRCRKSIKTLFKPSEEYEYKDLCVASGLILLSGMVHTEYTIPVIQFISYGILIIGILLKVILLSKNSQNKPLLWLSFVYLVCFSMAIPVMYRSFIPESVLFHIIEGISSFCLVLIFTFLMSLLFDEREDLFIPSTILLALALDLPVIILRWNEEINYFVLIFLSLSFLTFIVGIILKVITKKKIKAE